MSLKSLRAVVLFSAIAALFAIPGPAQGAPPVPFTAGNLVVYRVGDGVAALSTAAAPAFLDEYTPAGVIVQSVALPTAVSGSNRRLVATGNAGTEGLLVTYARCCFPIPGDAIFAFLSAGRGVVIHRENCVNVEDYRKHPEKWLPVTWQAAPDRLLWWPD